MRNGTGGGVLRFSSHGHAFGLFSLFLNFFQFLVFLGRVGDEVRLGVIVKTLQVEPETVVAARFLFSALFLAQPADPTTSPRARAGIILSPGLFLRR